MLRWLCERQSRFKTEAFPLDRRRYYGCLYEPKGWSVLYTLEDIQQGLLLPRGLGREVCLFKIYALQQAGLHRILSPGFTGWTFSPCLPGAVGEWLMHVCYIVMCVPLSRTVSSLSSCHETSRRFLRYSCQAAASVHERVRSDSKNLTLVALHKSEGTPFNSDADHPVSMAWRSL